MLSFFKKHNKVVIIAIIIVLAPIFINLIAICPAFCPDLVAGSQQSVWVNFFAVYSGSLIGAFVSFYILYKTIEANKSESEQNRADNHTESEASRKRLTAVFKYQVDRDILNTTKSSLANYIKSLNVLELGYIAIYPKEQVKNSLLQIKQISSNALTCYDMLEFALVEYDDEKEKEFKAYLKQFHNEYMGLIKDIGWILDFYLYNKIDVDSKKEALRYKKLEDDFGKYYNENKRIWNIIENGNYNIANDAAILMNKLLDDFGFSTINDRCTEFIKYEQNKIEAQILNT